MPVEPFEYPNLPQRPTGRGMRILSTLLPGVRETLRSVEPFAHAWAEHNARAAAATGPLWVVLGDSMAQGIGASAYDKGWPGQLAGQLDPAYRMVNLSYHGARVRDVFDRQWPAASALGPTALVTVVIGANDLIRRELRTALPAAFAELIDALPDDALIANLPNPIAEARAVDELLIAAARDHGLIRADMRGPGSSGWRGKLAADHFHPNDLGYASIAGVLAGAIHAAEGSGHGHTESEGPAGAQTAPTTGSLPPWA